MDRVTRLLIENWTVDYGDGHVERIGTPHSWKQDVPVGFEGPVIYRTEIEVPRKPSALRFHGVSYNAEVSVDGTLVATHRGIWDAFDLSLEPYAGKRIAIEVKVVKNGGPTFPVKDVASGFLPYVFNTFGGIYGDVELLDSGIPLTIPAPPSRVTVESHKVLVDGRPFYARGLLHWGWYPELGHTNAPEETIRSEVQAAKRLGFNLIKFCLWVPPHRYLKILREEGLEAWLELPLWDPSSDPERLKEIADEIERIVRQYRHHDNIVFWTIGCELSTATTSEYRQRLVQRVKNLTGSPLVKDNSGGAEMYGGDLREFGDFDDFHPYCDLPFYPPVLDSLLPGPRPHRPVLLGEFNDIDVHRDLARTADDMPFWASRMPELNDQGVRWQHDLPRFLPENRFALDPTLNKHRDLMESSRQKALFIRKSVHEAVRAREPLSGYVVTGMRDTPISSAGFFDDWGDARFSPEECHSWNGPDVLFQIPTRRPPWTNGGNRPGWMDPFNHFAGRVFLRIGLSSEQGMRGGLIWSISAVDGTVVAQGALEQAEVSAFQSKQVGEISWEDATPGAYRLNVELGGAANEWPLNVFAPWNADEAEGWQVSDSRNLLSGLGLKDAGDGSTATSRLISGAGEIEFRTDEGTIPMPFWRESAYTFAEGSWGLKDRWERLLPISGDCALDPKLIEDGFEPLIIRVDVRTYAEHVVAARKSAHIVTTLRPFGGLGIQPCGVTRNPSGAELLRAMISSLASS